MASQSIYFQSVNCTPRDSSRRLVRDDGGRLQAPPRMRLVRSTRSEFRGGSDIVERRPAAIECTDRSYHRRSATPIDLFIYIVYQLYIYERRFIYALRLLATTRGGTEWSKENEKDEGRSGKRGDSRKRLETDRSKEKGTSKVEHARGSRSDPPYEKSNPHPLPHIAPLPSSLNLKQTALCR